MVLSFGPKSVHVVSQLCKSNVDVEEYMVFQSAEALAFDQLQVPPSNYIRSSTLIIEALPSISLLR